MKNLVRLTIFGKVFHVTQGTEISVEEQRVHFLPKEGGYVFMDCVKFINGTSFYDSQTRGMTGRINAPCKNQYTGDVVVYNKQVTLIDNEFDAEDTTFMPKLDSSLVEMFIDENPDFNTTLAGFLRAIPIYFDFIYKSGRELLPSSWLAASSLMQEDEDIDVILAANLGTEIADSVMNYIQTNK